MLYPDNTVIHHKYIFSLFDNLIFPDLIVFTGIDQLSFMDYVCIKIKVDINSA